ncbi:MAG: hypothetical protein IPO58_14065 [Betaproteobacteria bacterium]|nr:hypothetical protein [Betaproteobacteria bacterium]
MCGLFMAFERGRPVDAARALRATGGLRHRGPDGEGHCEFTNTYPGPHGPVAVGCFAGHTRLAILDISAASSQPFRRRGRTLIHNGEIYNFRALRHGLHQQGTAFDTDGDTEVLFELVAGGGTDALHAANGMWAFCFLDEAAGMLTAARDRYGKKPLFYYADATSFCVASAIAPIYDYLGRRPEFVAADLDSFLRHGWLFPRSGGATHIQGIRQVAAGGALNFDLAAWTLTERRWFDLAAFSLAGPRDSEELAAIVKDAVQARLVADRKVGLLLSGGIDSSLILSVLCASGLAGNVSCFTGDAGRATTRTTPGNASSGSASPTSACRWTTARREWSASCRSAAIRKSRFRSSATRWRCRSSTRGSPSTTCRWCSTAPAATRSSGATGIATTASRSPRRSPPATGAGSLLRLRPMPTTRRSGRSPARQWRTPDRDRAPRLPGWASPARPEIRRTWTRSCGQRCGTRNPAIRWNTSAARSPRRWSRTRGRAGCTSGCGRTIATR